MTPEELFLRRLRRAQARRKKAEDKAIREAEFARKRQERKVYEYKKYRARLRLKALKTRIRSIKSLIRYNNWLAYSRQTKFQENRLRSTVINPDGSIAYSYEESYPTMVTEDTDRRGHSANPIRPLEYYPGTKWRQPSSYERFTSVTSYSDAEFHWYDSNGQVRLIEQGGCLDPLIVNYGPHLLYGLPIIQDYNLYARASTECRLKLQAMQVNIGENLATMKDSIHLLTSTATSLIRAYLAAKRGNWGQVGKAFGLSGKALGSGKALANRWLEYQFAWHPMMQDMHATAKLIQEGFRKKAFMFSAVRTTSDRKECKPSSGWVTSIKGQSTLSCRIKCYAAIDDEILAGLSSVGLIDPLTVAWELVPYSFLVDWFLPIGNFIQSIGAVNGLRFIGGSITWRTESEIQQAWRRPHPFIGLDCTDEGLVTTKNHAITRIPLFTWPDALPYSKNPFSTTHLLDAIALIRSAFK